MVEMSRNTGTARKEQAPEVSRVAASIGKAAFFAPEAVSTPSKRFPPLIIRLSKGHPVQGVWALMLTACRVPSDISPDSGA